MNNNTDLSIIIPVKNRLDLLKETVSSVLNQSSDAWNLIIVDDGSDEETLSYLQQLQSNYNRIRYISRTGIQRGPTVCRNQGAAIAKTKYLLFLDSDDILLKNAVHRRLEVMHRNYDLDFALFSTRAFYESTTDTHPWFEDWNGKSDLDRLLSMEWAINVSSPIWNKSYFIALGGFNENLPSWEDWELHVKALIQFPKYLRFKENDFLIRATRSDARVSSQQYRNSVHLEAASTMFIHVAKMLSNASILSFERIQFICEQQFSIAYLSLATDGLKTSVYRLNKLSQINKVRSRTINYYRLRLIWCYLKKITNL